MTFAEADALIEKQKRIPLHSPDLIGWELISADLDPSEPFSNMVLAKMIHDCLGVGGSRQIPYSLAQAEDGTLSLWTLPPRLHIEH